MLLSRLDRAKLAYDAYLANGRTFVFASVIFDHNSAARDAARQCTAILPAQLQNDLQLLVSHIDAWSAQWLELRSQMAPAAADRFVFESRVPFPRDSVRRLAVFQAARGFGSARS
jgi:hypothetical protein